MNTLSITPIPAFTDNYFWLLERGGQAVVVDPGDATPVLHALEQRQLTLAAILITHHHLDHIGGLRALAARFEVPVYGPRAESKTIPGLTNLLSERDRVRLEALDLDLEVWEVPGHTLGHIAYWCETPAAEGADAHSGFVLCGDTLFSAGCGRLFEGTPEQMHRSLSRLAALPADTAVYCTHEYTLANLAFAAAVEPGNADLQTEISRVKALRAKNLPSLPSRIGRERAINPFLRCSQAAVIQAAERKSGQALSSDLEVFTCLRRWKDGFRPPA